MLSLLRKKPVYLSASLAFFVLVVGVYGFASAGRKEPLLSDIHLSKGDILVSTSADGRAVADLRTELNFIGTGTIANISVNEGQRVEKGEELARLESGKLTYQLAQTQSGYDTAVAKLGELDAEPSDAEIAVKQSAVTNAQVALADAQASYDNTLDEYNAGRVSKDTLLTKQAQLDSAKAQLDNAEAQLEQALTPPDENQIEGARAAVDQAEAAVGIAEEALNETVLRAPIEGTILAINKNIGETVSGQSSSGTTPEPLIVIAETSRMSLEVQVEEVDITKISVGQKVSASFDALEDRTFSGKVDKISQSAKVDQNGVATYLVHASVNNKSGAVKDGMTVHVDFIIKEATDVIRLPVKAVTTSEGVSRVLVQSKNGVLTSKIVELGLTNGTYVEVKSGLSLADDVVIEGAK